MSGETVLEGAPLPPTPKVGGLATLPANLPVLPGGPEDFTPDPNLPATMEHYSKSWLEREKYWKQRVGTGWIPKRVLGSGGHGIVGHWTYEGIDKDLKSLTDVAVKQQVYKEGRGNLTDEERFYKMFRDSNTLHIPKMYRRVYTDQGTGTNPEEFDPFGRVQRMFLEYCESGDIGVIIRSRVHWWEINNGRFDITLPPLMLWEIFHCLSLGVLVMHTGKEKYDESARRWNRGEVVHFDLKPANIFVGSKTRDEEHINKRPVKIGDFGLAAEIIPGVPQDSGFMTRNNQRGTEIYLAPEQLYQNAWFGEGRVRPWHYQRNAAIRRPYYGTVTNIWQIGLIMHCVLHMQEYPNWYNPTNRSPMRCEYWTATPELQAGGYTVCVEEDYRINYEARRKPSSERLARVLYLILECLLIEPDARPTALELARRTREGLDNEREYEKQERIAENKKRAKEEREARRARNEDADSVMTDDDLEDFSPGEPYEEPLLSAQWYDEEPPAQPIQQYVPKTAQQASRQRKEQYRKMQAQERDTQATRQAEALQQQQEVLLAKLRNQEPYNQQPVPAAPPMMRPITRKPVAPAGRNEEAPLQQGGPANIPNIPGLGEEKRQLGVPAQVRGSDGFEQQPLYGNQRPNQPRAPTQGQNPPPRPQPVAPGYLNPNPAIININPPPQPPAPYPNPPPPLPRLAPRPTPVRVGAPFPQRQPQRLPPGPFVPVRAAPPPPQQVPQRPPPARVEAPPPPLRINPAMMPPMLNLTFICQASPGMFGLGREPDPVTIRFQAILATTTVNELAIHLEHARAGIPARKMQFYTGRKYWLPLRMVREIAAYMIVENIDVVRVYDKLAY